MGHNFAWRGAGSSDPSDDIGAGTLRRDEKPNLGRDRRSGAEASAIFCPPPENKWNEFPRHWSTVCDRTVNCWRVINPLYSVRVCFVLAINRVSPFWINIGNKSKWIKRVMLYRRRFTKSFEMLYVYKQIKVMIHPWRYVYKIYMSVNRWRIKSICRQPKYWSTMRQINPIVLMGLWVWCRRLYWQ